MDVLSKLSREAQAVLGGGVLLLILSFLDWSQWSFGPVSYGWNEWHGIGFLAALLVIVMVAWEVMRLMQAKIELGSLSPGLISVALALLVALFTIITVFDFPSQNWPAWIGLIVALVVGAAAVMRARAEGVQMPQGMPGGSAAPAAPAAPSAPPVEPTEPMEGPVE